MCMFVSSFHWLSFREFLSFPHLFLFVFLTQFFLVHCFFTSSSLWCLYSQSLSPFILTCYPWSIYITQRRLRGVKQEVPQDKRRETSRGKRGVRSHSITRFYSFVACNLLCWFLRVSRDVIPSVSPFMTCLLFFRSFFHSFTHPILLLSHAIKVPVFSKRVMLLIVDVPLIWWPPSLPLFIGSKKNVLDIRSTLSITQSSMTISNQDFLLMLIMWHRLKNHGLNYSRRWQKPSKSIMQPARMKGLQLIKKEMHPETQVYPLIK